MKRLAFLFLIFNLLLGNLLANTDTTNVYLIAGTGSDHRLFNKLEWPDNYVPKHIEYVMPDKGMNMSEYACKLAEQIDTNQPFILMGSSLGGMLATEMGDFLDPEKIILISSAKGVTELPKQLKFQKKIPIHKIFGGRFYKYSAFIAQPIVEPQRNKEKATFVAMLKDKEPDFLKRAIPMILNWERTTWSDKIVSIHGEKDNTIPYKNVQADYVVSGGSHMMTLTRPDEISEILKEVLK